MLPPAILNATIPKYYMGFGLFMARENLSKTYSWVAFLTAFIIAELPFALLMTVVYYVVWYFPVGLPLGNGAGLSFIMTLLFMLFMPIWSIWLCASAPSPHFVMNSMPFHLVVLNLINGIIIQYNNMPVIWLVYYHLNKYITTNQCIIGVTLFTTSILLLTC